VKARWKEWSARIDELSLRERALLFVGGAIAVVLVAHALLLQPLTRQQRGYLDRIRQDESQLKSVQETIDKLARSPADAAATARAERVRQLEGQLANAEKHLGDKRNVEISPERLPSLLRDVLGSTRQVRMLSLRVVPSSAIAPDPVSAKPAAGKPPPPAIPALPQLYRHGVEIEMAGPYLDLLKYLEDVEALPWNLRLTQLELKTTTHPEVRLRAMLYTVSTSPSLITL